jgi:ABC-type sugar transport system ATPase subunit
LNLLSATSVSKSFGGTPALKGVSFTLRAGEITGLIGENGAGKSTLIKILSGVLRHDSGGIEWKGKTFSPSSAHEALRAGIATIHQELASFETLTVAENLMLAETWPRFPWGGTNWAALFAEARRRLEQCDLAINPEALFQTLSPAQRQEVAIARALSHKAELLILDEPTASLSEPEVARLIGHLRRLRKNGAAILYVSHRLDEIMALTDRVLVLRDGVLVRDYATAEASVDRMVRDMVGRELADEPASVETSSLSRDPVLTVENLSSEGVFNDVSFTVHGGEIVGLAGLVGAGRSEVARAIYGLEPAGGGSLRVNGEDYSPRHPADARTAGIAYVPEERKRQGLVLEHSISSNISIGFLSTTSGAGWIFRRVEKVRVSDAIERFGVRVRGEPLRPIGTLSGGNQQKALLARWLESDPAIIILDEPTRGVDVGAKAGIHSLVQDLARAGKAILLISSDLPEILKLSTRLYVMHKGRITAQFKQVEATQEKVLLAASGLGGNASD